MSRPKGSAAAGTALRLLRMMQEIPRRGGGRGGCIGTRELTERLAAQGFRVTQRTVQRDLRDLQRWFPGLRDDGNRDRMGWFWEADSPVHDVPAMSPAIAFAFRVAERVLEPVMPEPLRPLRPYLDAAHRLLESQAAGWAEKVLVVPRALPLRPAPVAPPVLETLYEALAGARRIQARYRPRGGAPGQYELSPLGLVLRHEVAYLVATAWDYDDVRHYALHRFDPQTMALLDTPAHVPEGFDLEAYVAGGEFQYRVGDPPLRLRLRMRETVARHLEETPLSEDQRITAARRGWVRIRATVADTLQLRWWLLALGANVVVEGPAALRRELAASLREAASRYAAPPESDDRPVRER